MPQHLPAWPGDPRRLQNRVRIGRRHGSRLQTWTLAVVALTALAASPRARAGTLHIAVEDLPCPAREELTREIATRVADLMVAQPDLALLLAAPQPAALAIRLVGTRDTYERTLPFSAADCAAVPTTVGILLRTWLSRPLVAAAAAAGDAPPPPPPAVAPPPPEPPRLPPSMRFTGSVGLFQGLGQSAGAGPAYALSVERSVAGPFGLALGLSRDSALHTENLTGTVSAGIWKLGLAVRMLARSSDAACVDLLTGPALALIDVQTSGFTTMHPTTLVDVAWVAAARLRVRIAEPVWFTTSAELTFRRHRETLLVDGNHSALSLDPTRIQFLAGVAVDAL